MKAYNPIKGHTNVILLYGLKGSGKTTIATKYAQFYKKKGFKCAIVDTSSKFPTCNRFNLSFNSIPIYIDSFEIDPVKIAKTGIEIFKKDMYDIIIVDTCLIFDEIINVNIKPNETILVVDSSSECQSIIEIISTFKVINNGQYSIILTKLDNIHSKGVGILNLIAMNRLPISFLGYNEIYDSFEQFNTESFVSKLLGQGNLTILHNYYPKSFTFRDLKTQLNGILKKGKLNILHVFDDDSLVSRYSEEEYTINIKKYLTIINSMNEIELDCSDITKLTNLESRINRIARGSGKNSKQVVELLNNWKQFANVVSQLGYYKPSDGSGPQPKMY